jgi:hypothetical protein
MNRPLVSFCLDLSYLKRPTLAANQGVTAMGQRSYPKRIVYLSFHRVITVIMVWRLWVRRTAPLEFIAANGALSWPE